MSQAQPLSRKFLAELIGTFVLVFGGCGSAVLAAVFPYAQAESNPLGLGFLGVSLAFGLTVLVMAYAIGHVSGCHINPAVSFGLWASGRFRGSELLPYIVAQVLGAVIAGGFIYGIASGRAGFELSGSNPLATNGFGAHSPGGYGLISALVIEVLLTFIFLLVILGSTPWQGAHRVRRSADRPLPHPDPSDQHPGHQYVGEPCAQHRCGALGRW